MRRLVRHSPAELMYCLLPADSDATDDMYEIGNCTGIESGCWLVAIWCVMNTPIHGKHILLCLPL